MAFASSELIINSDNSIYHLHLQPDQIADLIITVGDPNRVERVSRHFDRIDTRVSKREFVTHTGELGGRRISVISTGIGTDNIDIVLNELDALARIDLKTRQLLPAEQQRQLRFVRLGTSGCLQPDLAVDSILVSAFAIGLDGLMGFYDLHYPQKTRYLLDHLQASMAAASLHIPGTPYAAQADEMLLNHFSTPKNYQGITLTAAGFYGPQARELRLKTRLNSKIIDALTSFNYLPTANNKSEQAALRITNLEMETAGIYALAQALGHKAISISALLANRTNGTFSQNARQTVDSLIEWALERLTSLPLSSDE
ncbi:MAG: nucleoside phosphorylase [Bacteroidota bacterium]